jgi:hypothetical protein
MSVMLYAFIRLECTSHIDTTFLFCHFIAVCSSLLPLIKGCCHLFEIFFFFFYCIVAG